MDQTRLLQSLLSTASGTNSHLHSGPRSQQQLQPQHGQKSGEKSNVASTPTSATYPLYQSPPSQPFVGVGLGGQPHSMQQHQQGSPYQSQPFSYSHYPPPGLFPPQQTQPQHMQIQPQFPYYAAGGISPQQMQQLQQQQQQHQQYHNTMQYNPYLGATNGGYNNNMGSGYPSMYPQIGAAPSPASSSRVSTTGNNSFQHAAISASPSPPQIMASRASSNDSNGAIVVMKLEAASTSSVPLPPIFSGEEQSRLCDTVEPKIVSLPDDFENPMDIEKKVPTTPDTGVKVAVKSTQEYHVVKETKPVEELVMKIDTPKVLVQKTDKEPVQPAVTPLSTPSPSSSKSSAIIQRLAQKLAETRKLELQKIVPDQVQAQQEDAPATVVVENEKPKEDVLVIEVPKPVVDVPQTPDAASEVKKIATPAVVTASQPQADTQKTAVAPQVPPPASRMDGKTARLRILKGKLASMKKQTLDDEDECDKMRSKLRNHHDTALEVSKSIEDLNHKIQPMLLLLKKNQNILMDNQLKMAEAARAGTELSESLLVKRQEIAQLSFEISQLEAAAGSITPTLLTPVSSSIGTPALQPNSITSSKPRDIAESSASENQPPSSMENLLPINATPAEGQMKHLNNNLKEKAATVDPKRVPDDVYYPMYAAWTGESILSPTASLPRGVPISTSGNSSKHGATYFGLDADNASAKNVKRNRIQ